MYKQYVHMRTHKLFFLVASGWLGAGIAAFSSGAVASAPGLVATQYFPANGGVPMDPCRWTNWREEVVRRLIHPRLAATAAPLHRIWVPAGLLIFTGRGRVNHRAMIFLRSQGDHEEFLVQARTNLPRICIVYELFGNMCVF